MKPPYFSWVSKAIVAAALIALLAVIVPAGAAAPVGLNTADWSAIRALLPAPAQQACLKASNAGANDLFGLSVAVDGDTAVVGAPGEASSNPANPADDSAFATGAAYVFVRDGATWSQQATLKAPDAQAYDFFGASVAVDGDTVVVGAPFGEGSGPTDPADTGAAYVFVRDGAVWSQQATLTASNAGTNDDFGRMVAMDGDTVVVGAASEDSSDAADPADNSAPFAGAAYVFVRDGAVWSQQAYLKASNAETDDRFGYSVAVDGDTAVVGAQWEAGSGAGGPDDPADPADNSAPFAGAAYVFVRDGAVWSQQAYLKATNAETDDRFGYSVAVDGDTAVVGTPGENSGDAEPVGAAYVFVRDGAGWTEQTALKVSNAGGMDGFGASVAVDGHTAVVGAYLEDGNGADGPDDNSATDAGAAYVFVRDGASWSQGAYLKASNAGTYDYFGYSVAVDGDTAVVGAYGEDGSSADSPDDNSATNAGAAYVFEEPAGALTITKATDPAGGTGFPFTLDPGAASFDTEWGGNGSLEGQFTLPIGVAVDGAGNVYVVDSHNHRVQKFAGDGRFLGQWGSEGSLAGQFKYPRGVAVDGAGNVYVTDQENHRVQKFADDGRFLGQWGSEGSLAGQFKYPRGVAVDGAGNLYVADSNNHRVQKFSDSGGFLGQWGGNGSEEGQFWFPDGVAVDKAGNVYVVDSGNERVQKFDGDGDFLGQWGSEGGGEGQFRYPRGVVVDGAGHVYVVDSGHDRVQKFDGDGDFLGQWGDYGSDAGLFNTPYSVAVDDAGHVYVADSYNHRVQKFSQTGAVLDDGQSHTFPDLAPGRYFVSELVPPDWAVTRIVCEGASSAAVDVAAGTATIDLADDEAVTCTFTNTKIIDTAIFMSARTAGTTGDGLAFRSDDILKWNGEAWSKWFDGEEAGLKPKADKHNVNAFWIPDPDGEEVILSFAQNRWTVPGIAGKVDGTDLVRWDGEDFSLYFDGSDVGLTVKVAEKIDGLHVLPGDASPINGGVCQAYLLISTKGAGKVPQFGGGVLKFRGEDVLGFCATRLGGATAGFWHMVLDGSTRGLPVNAIDSLSLSEDGGTLYLTTKKAIAIPADSVSGGHSMVYAYDFGAQTFSGPHFKAPANGLTPQVDGLQVEGGLP